METTLRLIKAHINNFKSLEDVTLNFRDLTIIVGANSSGKSNSIFSLYHLSRLVRAATFPPINDIRIGNEQNIGFELIIQAEKNIHYTLSINYFNFEAFSEPIIVSERLQVGDTTVININRGIGDVRDEDNTNNFLSYESSATLNTLALTSVGNFGKKPLTQKLNKFIRAWRFYNFEPDTIRDYEDIDSFNEKVDQSISLDPYGKMLQVVLSNWARNDQEKFESLSQEIKRYLNISLHWHSQGDQFTYAIEDDGLDMPLKNLSDGTLRIIAYCTLLFESNIPPLICIEEPERNLHPAILEGLASILIGLSKRTQVVITTHSSQLLDCFKAEDIYDNISLILLKKTKSGTQAYNADDLGSEALSDWMSDFGIGSAIFHSNLLNEILEKK